MSTTGSSIVESTPTQERKDQIIGDSTFYGTTAGALLGGILAVIHLSGLSSLVYKDTKSIAASALAALPGCFLAPTMIVCPVMVTGMAVGYLVGRIRTFNLSEE